MALQKKQMKILIIVGIILGILLVWGLIGSSIVSDIGKSCDIGINKSGSMFCWKWHQNVIGDIGDAIDKALGR